MAKMTVDGLNEYLKQLNKLSSEAEKINHGALGEAAGMVADAIGSALESMPVRPDKTHPHKLYGATQSEKDQIINNFGISKFKSSGGKTDTSIGFTGYVDTPSEAFNGHIPTGMLIQCINYGTEFRKATHTVDKAIKSVKGQVPKVIQDYIDKEVGRIIK